ncbi:TPA: restriction endonuclease [Vibrio diabolicus]|nr:restriction endonuclease [Vibrio parahaemolyticus]
MSSEDKSRAKMLVVCLIFSVLILGFLFGWTTGNSAWYILTFLSAPFAVPILWGFIEGYLGKSKFDSSYYANQLRQKIIDTSSKENWFSNNFTSPNDLYVPQENEEYGRFTYMIGSDIREAIVKDFLVEHDYYSKLLLKRRQLVYTDNYGDRVFDDWFREVQNFTARRDVNIVSHLLSKTPKVLADELKATERWDNYVFQDEHLTDEMWSVVDTVLDSFDDLDVIEHSLNTEDPYEYERLISSKLCGLGWDAYATSGSGDQGADVVAEKYGVRFVMQCKLYSQPVGNKAVQEVSSARDFYDAFGAVVVTNNGYTKSARQLAESQTVWLLHDSELEEWDRAVEGILVDL